VQKEREPVVKFSEKNVYYSAPKLPFSAVSLERMARDILMRKLKVEPKNKDQDIIRKISKELVVAKEAMDDCLYNDLRTGDGTYSIVPFAQIEE
jgi:hypothetical protein